MGIATQIFGLLLSLTILVFTHELGHFFFARLFKTRVDKFYLFFNPGFSIVRMKKINGKMRFSFFSSRVPEEWNEYPETTEWGLGWLPLGGYCSINGMVDETTKPGELPAEPQPYEFRSKPAWQRFFIIIGGVLMNFITALIIYSAVIFTWGEEYIPMDNASYGIQFTEVAKNIGFQDGDKIVSIDGKAARDLSDFVKAILIENTKTVTVDRNGTLVNIDIPKEFNQKVLADGGAFCSYNYPFVVAEISKGSPAEKANMQPGDSLISVNDIPYSSFIALQQLLGENKEQEIDVVFSRNDSLHHVAVQLGEEGKLGVLIKSPFDFIQTKVNHYGFFESIPKGISTGVNTLTDYVKQFKLIATKEGVKQLGGFGTIGSIFPKQWDWQRFWTMTGFLAIILAFMNILPIPALDGGYILFILVEMISGRKPSDKFIGYANMVGLALLLLLVLYANGMDIIRAISR